LQPYAFILRPFEHESGDVPLIDMTSRLIVARISAVKIVPVDTGTKYSSLLECVENVLLASEAEVKNPANVRIYNDA